MATVEDQNLVPSKNFMEELQVIYIMPSGNGGSLIFISQAKRNIKISVKDYSHVKIKVYSVYTDYEKNKTQYDSQNSEMTQVFWIGDVTYNSNIVINSITVQIQTFNYLCLNLKTKRALLCHKRRNQEGEVEMHFVIGMSIDAFLAADNNIILTPKEIIEPNSVLKDPNF